MLLRKEIGLYRMFDQYQVDGLFDEMFEVDGSPRPHYAAVASRLKALGSAAFNKRVRMADLTFRIYVAVVTIAPSLAMSVFVFDTASTLNNINVTPNRSITLTTSTYGTMGLFVDVAHDRLFVADSSGDVFVIENAHSKSGGPTSPPDRVVILPSPVTRLAVDTVNDRLYAAGGTSALYIVPGVSTASGSISATAVLPSATGNFTAVAITP